MGRSAPFRNPRPEVALACGSRSTRSTLRSRAARAAPRLIAVVVFPTPPFWLAMAMTRPMVNPNVPRGTLPDPCRLSLVATRRPPSGRPRWPAGAIRGPSRRARAGRPGKARGTALLRRWSRRATTPRARGRGLRRPAPRHARPPGTSPPRKARPRDFPAAPGGFRGWGRGTDRETCRRNSDRLLRGSRADTERSGRQMASGTPGKPAPEPMSRTEAPRWDQVRSQRGLQRVVRQLLGRHGAGQVHRAAPPVQLREKTGQGFDGIGRKGERESRGGGRQEIPEGLRR